MRRGIVFFAAFVLVVFTLQGALAADERSFTIVNSKDWQDLYLGAMYADAIDSEFIFFTNLADTQLKTKMMLPEDDVVVFESKTNPVVKNYPSLLKVNGFQNYESIFYDSFHDLQELFVDELDDYIKGFFVFDASFGMNPVAAAPLLAKKQYVPLFLDKQNVKYISSTTSGEPTYLVGRIPLRLVKDVEGTRIEGYSYQTLEAVTGMVIDEFPDAEWGILTRIDIVDLATITKQLPIFVYYGDEYLDTLARLVGQTSISNFEVIGGPTVDIARSLELRSQRNLNFMLKYGRRVTNYPGFDDAVLDLDAARFAFPVESLEVAQTAYYPAMGVLAITFKNTGNVDILHFSNLEFAGSALSDVGTHFILKGEEKTVPFQILPSNQNADLTLTTRYGVSIPLKFELGTDDDTTLFYDEEVDFIADYDDVAEVHFVSSVFDTAQGVLELIYKNPTTEPVFLYAELKLDDDQVLSSPQYRLDPGEKETISIETPFVADEDILGETKDITAYYGHKDTLLTQTNAVLIKKKTTFSTLTGWVTLDYADKPVHAGITTLLLILLVGLIIFFLRRKQDEKKGKKGKTQRSFVSQKKTRAKKTSTKKRSSRSKNKT